MLGTLNEMLYALTAGRNGVAYTLTFTFAVIAFVAVLVLFLKRKNRLALWVLGAGFAELWIGFEVKHVREAGAYQILDNGIQRMTMETPSGIAVLLSVIMTGVFGWLTYRAVRTRKLALIACAVTALVAGLIIATEMVALWFGYGSRAGGKVFEVRNVLCDHMIAVPVAFVLAGVTIRLARVIVRRRKAKKAEREAAQAANAGTAS